MTQIALTQRERERIRALARANAVSLERAELKRRIAAQELSAAAVLLQPAPAVLRRQVAELLISQPRWGRATCDKLLLRNGIWGLMAVGALTEHQWRLLAAQLQ